jgi:hypothetical protein
MNFMTFDIAREIQSDRRDQADRYRATRRAARARHHRLAAVLPFPSHPRPPAATIADPLRDAS